MAEFLIYNKTHWMDELSVAEIAERVKENSHLQAKYDARYQRGDIVEIRPDGYWSQDRAGHGKHAFALVVLPGLGIKDAQHYMDTWERDVAITQTKEDISNHIYEYSGLLNRTSSYEKELFGETDFLVSHLPAGISILNKSITSVFIRFEPLTIPNVKPLLEILAISDEKERKKYTTPEKCYEDFRIEDIPDIKKLLCQRKCQMDMAQISLSAEKAVTIIKISEAHITDKSTVVVNG